LEYSNSQLIINEVEHFYIKEKWNKQKLF